MGWRLARLKPDAAERRGKLFLLQGILLQFLQQSPAFCTSVPWTWPVEWNTVSCVWEYEATLLQKRLENCEQNGIALFISVLGSRQYKTNYSYSKSRPAGLLFPSLSLMVTKYYQKNKKGESCCIPQIHYPNHLYPLLLCVWWCCFWDFSKCKSDQPLTEK